MVRYEKVSKTQQKSEWDTYRVIDVHDGLLEVTNRIVGEWKSLQIFAYWERAQGSYVVMIQDEHFQVGELLELLHGTIKKELVNWGYTLLTQ